MNQNVNPNSVPSSIDSIAAEGVNLVEYWKSELKKNADEIEARVKEYTDTAITYAKNNPAYVTAGVFALGFAAGLLMTRQGRK